MSRSWMFLYFLIHLRICVERVIRSIVCVPIWNAVRVVQNSFPFTFNST
jgi:hypothetical protein